MKELTIEQKAKAYDLAIDRAKKWYNAPNIDKMPTYGNRIIEEIFPELKESEDERIRKELINYLITDEDNGVPKVGQIPIDNVITWLEKQKTIDVLDAEEREFADNVNSYRKDMDEFYKKGYDAGREAERQYWLDSVVDFKAMDWYVSKVDGKIHNIYNSVDKVEPKFKADDWVVSPNGVYWHIDRIENNRYEVTSDTGKCADWPLDTDLYHLWTIQDAKKGDVLACGKCILIFDQLSEFNNERVLMDICHCTSKGFYWQDTKDRDLWALDGFKPATKEQRDTLFAKMHEAGFEWDAEKKELKKIEEKSAEWRQDNVEELTEFENAMMHIGGSFFGENAGLDPNDTDAIKEQANLLLELVPKQEWSVEDKSKVQRICKYLDEAKKYYADIIEVRECMDWLKSLEDRYTWKPSEKQMEALKEACDEHWEPDGLDPLYTLYQELKKLREE